MNWLVIRNIDGYVENVVVWDGQTHYKINDCYMLPVPSDPVGVWIGWKLVDGQWEPPITEEVTNEQS